jgi:ATP-dependent Clp protease ATP-binding subunit ClpX
MEHTPLDFSPDAHSANAPKAIAITSGARGLRSIMETILLDTMFELPSLSGVEQIVVNGEVVEGRARPLFIYSDRREDVGSSA